eukprot:Mycagemm_TRINITY_DN10248_c0_g1::TRINITY_DN10248_c0_g1_i1::g.4062::m.4062 type:complete len:106 gc:universal TRINITY_DN10248_c0_g1_i1:244-561(+)
MPPPWEPASTPAARLSCAGATCACMTQGAPSSPFLAGGAPSAKSPLASNRSTRLTTAPGGPSAVPTKHFGRIASLILARSSPCSAGPRTSTCASLAGCSTTTATP